METSRRKLTTTVGKSLVLLAVGAGAYFTLDVVDRALVARRLPPAPTADELPTAELPPLAAAATSPETRQGNPWLQQAVVQLEQRVSFAAELVQTGWVGGELVETHGGYLQLGAGAERRFITRLQGRLGEHPTQVTRVSDGRFLWTDVRWGGDQQDADRRITRVDLRRLRRESGQGPQLAPGQAVADLATPADEMRHGGLPMLLAGLDQRFDFGPAREMQLRGERVVAVVGRWSPARLDEMVGKTDAKLSDLPTRAPHHVVVALGRESLFPLLVEYRSASDPMAAPGLPDEALLRPSPRPLLKMDLLRPVFDAPVAESEFAYSPPQGVAWRDETDRELRIVKAERDRTLVAAGPGAPRR